MLSKIFQNIICSLKSNGHVIVFLFDFLIAHTGRTIVCHCCCFNDNILFLTDRGYSLIHISGCYHWNHSHKWWRCKCSTSTYQCDICSAQHSHFCNGIAHLAGRMVGNITDRINCLLGRTGGNQHLQPFHILLTGTLSQNIV